MSVAITAEFGRRDEDGKAWITIKAKETEAATFVWPGGLKRASAIAQAINGLKAAERALKAVRADCRDPDTDSLVSSKTGELVDEALMAFGVKP